jgi:hypothetical protein
MIGKTTFLSEMLYSYRSTTNHICCVLESKIYRTVDVIRFLLIKASATIHFENFDVTLYVGFQIPT